MSRLQRAALAVLVSICETILRECGDGWSGVRNSAAVLQNEITRVRTKDGFNEA
jgi:hypothetical protein